MQFHFLSVNCFKSINNGFPEKIVPVYGDESEPFVFPAGPSWIALKIPDA